MTIKSVEMYDENSNEATIVISTGNNELKCYCFDYSVDSKLKGILKCLVKEIFFSKNKYEFIKKGEGYYSYLINGKIKNLDIGIVECNGFNFITDEFPDNAIIDDFVLINAIRIDIE